MKGVGGVAALVAALSGACLFLMWKYTGWRRRVCAAATVLLCIAVAVAFVPVLTGVPKEEPTIVRVSDLETAPVAAGTPTASPPAETPPSETPPPEEAPPEAQADRETPPDMAATPETPPETRAAAETPPPAPQESAAPQAPAHYVLNTSTKKFHLPTCSDAKRIKDENRATIDTRQGALDGGYVACKNCKP